MRHLLLITVIDMYTEQRQYLLITVIDMYTEQCQYLLITVIDMYTDQCQYLPECQAIDQRQIARIHNDTCNTVTPITH